MMTKRKIVCYLFFNLRGRKTKMGRKALSKTENKKLNKRRNCNLENSKKHFRFNFNDAMVGKLRNEYDDL